MDETLALHPYYPLHISLPLYEPNDTPVPALLGVFFTTCGLLLVGTWLAARRLQPSIAQTDLYTTLWFVLSGTIHIIFEGYGYVYHYREMASSQTWLGQMWKLYALSDSRYLTQHSLVLCMEAVTAVLWGPGCLLCAWGVVQRKSWRWPLQVLVSGGQMYGDFLYMATVVLEDWVDGTVYSRPEGFYYWFYFVGCNSVWIVVPGLLILQSSVKAAGAIARVDRLEMEKKWK